MYGTKTLTHSIKTRQLVVEIRYSDAFMTATRGRVDLDTPLMIVIALFEAPFLIFRGNQRVVSGTAALADWPTILNLGFPCRWIFSQADPNIETVVVTGMIPSVRDLDPLHAPKLVVVLEGSEPVPNLAAAGHVIATLRLVALNQAEAYWQPWRSLVGKEPFRSPELWVNGQAEIDRLIVAAQGTALEDQSDSAVVLFSSSKHHHKTSPEDGLCKALGFETVVEPVPTVTVAANS